MSMLKLLERVTTPDDVDTNKGLDAVELSSSDCSLGIAYDPLTQFAVIFCGLIHDVRFQEQNCVFVILGILTKAIYSFPPCR